MSGPGADPTAELDGASAPPRANGELVFTAPWQSRLFATTMALCERELLEWEGFRQSLIGEISAHGENLTEAEDYDYWGCWQRALEHRLASSGVVDPGVLGERAAAFAARPAGHDHEHDHDHH